MQHNEGEYMPLMAENETPEQLMQAAVQLAARIHRRWDAEPDGTPMKSKLGAAWDKASEAEFFLKDAAEMESGA